MDPDEHRSKKLLRELAPIRVKSITRILCRWFRDGKFRCSFDLRQLLPLPEGEGRGEGEGLRRFPNGSESAFSVKPLTVALSLGDREQGSMPICENNGALPTPVAPMACPAALPAS